MAKDSIKSLGDILESFFDRDEALIREWLNTPNIFWRGKTPSEILEKFGYFRVLNYCRINMLGSRHKR